MNDTCSLKRAAETYLAAYYSILEEMICGMTNASLSDSISHNFIVQMIPHHRAAIRMSQNLLKYTSDKALQEIASGIITEQTKSIENMRAIEQRCGCVSNTCPELQLYQEQMNCIMCHMFSKMRRARSSVRIDCDFMREMIPHHEGAVKMSETTLQNHICHELKPILEAIITSQKRGIAEMQNLLCRLGC